MTDEREDGQTELEEFSSPTGVVIGEQDTEVSFQILQSVYNELTGKKEEVSRRYEIPIRTTMEDLKQLDFRIKQMCEPFSIQSQNMTITVYYQEDTREVYSSFERFQIIDSSSIHPIETIEFKYNFLIVPPKSRRPQSCTLTVQIASRVTLLYKTRRDDMPISFRRIFGQRMFSALVTVNYVDYVIARNLLDGVERWVKGIPNHPFPRWFKLIRRNSEKIRLCIMYAVGAFAAYMFTTLVPVYVPPHEPDFQVLAYYFIIGSLSVFVAFRLGRFAGSLIEEALDESIELSYIKLNRGDEKRIAQEKSRI